MSIQSIPLLFTASIHITHIIQPIHPSPLSPLLSRFLFLLSFSPFRSLSSALFGVHLFSLFFLSSLFFIPSFSSFVTRITFLQTHKQPYNHTYIHTSTYTQLQPHIPPVYYHLTQPTKPSNYPSIPASQPTSPCHSSLDSSKNQVHTATLIHIHQTTYISPFRHSYFPCHTHHIHVPTTTTTFNNSNHNNNDNHITNSEHQHRQLTSTLLRTLVSLKSAHDTPLSCCLSHEANVSFRTPSFPSCGSKWKVTLWVS